MLLFLRMFGGVFGERFFCVYDMVDRHLVFKQGNFKAAEQFIKKRVVIQRFNPCQYDADMAAWFGYLRRIF